MKIQILIIIKLLKLIDLIIIFFLEKMKYLMEALLLIWKQIFQINMKSQAIINILY